MRSKNDYYKKILGLSLFPQTPSSEALSEEKRPFCFFCDEDDAREQKVFLDKVLKAIHKETSLVCFKVQDVLDYKEVFSFSLAELNHQNVHLFPSLKEVSQSPNLKAKLWSHLKKF